MIKFKHLLLIILLQHVFFTVNAELTDDEIAGLLICYKQKIDEAQTGIEKYNIAFSNYPHDKLYKLFIDKYRLLNPKNDEEKNIPPHLMFDVKEPGYYESMINAFNRLPEFIGSEPSFELIVTLHDLAVDKVAGMSKGFLPGEFGYNIKSSKVFSNSLRELLFSKILAKPLYKDLKAQNEYLAIKMGPRIKSLPMNINSIRIQSIFSTKEELVQKLNPLFEHYRQSIQSMQTLDGKLSAIGELLRALEVAHFLPDGNQRTYAFLLLTKLLIENGITPALLEDPLMFDGYLTVSELSKAIRIGLKNFLNENEDSQRVLLSSEECKAVNLFAPKVTEWLNGEDDYQPYFLKASNMTSDEYYHQYPEPRDDKHICEELVWDYLKEKLEGDNINDKFILNLCHNPDVDELQSEFLPKLKNKIITMVDDEQNKARRILQYIKLGSRILSLKPAQQRDLLDPLLNSRKIIDWKNTHYGSVSYGHFDLKYHKQTILDFLTEFEYSEQEILDFINGLSEEELLSNNLIWATFELMIQAAQKNQMNLFKFVIEKFSQIETIRDYKDRTLFDRLKELKDYTSTLTTNLRKLIPHLEKGKNAILFDKKQRELEINEKTLESLEISINLLQRSS